MITPERIENAEAELRRARVDAVLVDFGRALAELNTEHDWPRFLERPDKWAAEYVAWLDRDRPSDYGSAGWDAFADAIEEVRR